MGKDNAWGEAFSMFLFPAVICGLYGRMSTYDSGLLTYNLGGTIYSFGARGYTVNGVAHMEPRFDYPAWPIWPEVVRGMPKLFAAHFAMAIILGVYIVMYATIFILNADWRKKYPDAGARGTSWGMSLIKQVVNRRGYVTWVTPVILLVLLGLTVTDMAMVILACRLSDFNPFVPTPACLRISLGISAGVLVVLWTAVWVIIRLTNRTKAKGIRLEPAGRCEAASMPKNLEDEAERVKLLEDMP